MKKKLQNLSSALFTALEYRQPISTDWQEFKFRLDLDQSLAFGLKKAKLFHFFGFKGKGNNSYGGVSL